MIRGSRDGFAEVGARCARTFSPVDLNANGVTFLRAGTRTFAINVEGFQRINGWSQAASAYAVDLITMDGTGAVELELVQVWTSPGGMGWEWWAIPPHGCRTIKFRCRGVGVNALNGYVAAQARA